MSGLISCGVSHCIFTQFFSRSNRSHPFHHDTHCTLPSTTFFFYSNPSVQLDVCIFITYNGEIDHE